MNSLLHLIKPYQVQLNCNGEIKIECTDFTLNKLHKESKFKFYHREKAYYFIYKNNEITVISKGLVFYIKDGQGILYTSYNDLCNEFNFTNKEKDIKLSLVSIMLKYINMFKHTKNYMINIFDKNIVIKDNQTTFLKCNYFNDYLTLKLANIKFTFDNYPNPTLEIKENFHKILIKTIYENNITNIILSIKNVEQIDNILSQYYYYCDKELSNYRSSYNISKKGLLFYEENNILGVIFRDKIPLLKVIYHEKDNLYVPKRKIKQNKQIITFTNELIIPDDLLFTSYSQMVNQISNNINYYYNLLHDL